MLRGSATDLRREAHGRHAPGRARARGGAGLVAPGGRGAYCPSTRCWPGRRPSGPGRCLPRRPHLHCGNTTPRSRRSRGCRRPQRRAPPRVAGDSPRGDFGVSQVQIFIRNHLQISAVSPYHLHGTEAVTTATWTMQPLSRGLNRPRVSPGLVAGPHVPRPSGTGESDIGHQQ